MWGAREPFPPAAAMVVAVVTPVVFCTKAAETFNKTLKLVVCNQFSYELLYIVKHIIINISLIVAWTKPCHRPWPYGGKHSSLKAAIC
jgi:hypothetical protein